MDETAEKLNAFTELLGQIADAEIANLAELPVTVVAAAREERGIAPYEAERPPDPDPEPDPEPDPDTDEAPKRRRKSKPKAAEVVAEVIPVIAPLVIRLLRTVFYTTRNAKGKPIRIPLAASIYRGEMAHKVAALVPEDQRDAIEVLS